MVMGTGEDGGYATGPRSGWDCVDLKTGYHGGPFPDHLLLDVYIGTAPSAVPSILARDLRAFLRPGDRDRQLKCNATLEPVPIALVVCVQEEGLCHAVSLEQESFSLRREHTHFVH